MRKVINVKNRPSMLPIVSSAVCYLLLDRLAAPAWLWGVAAAIFGIMWVAIVIDIATSRELPPFE